MENKEKNISNFDEEDFKNNNNENILDIDNLFKERDSLNLFTIDIDKKMKLNHYYWIKN